MSASEGLVVFSNNSVIVVQTIPKALLPYNNNYISIQALVDIMLLLEETSSRLLTW
ncbi:hypothetical protein Glove_139g40 [Diversispora epigaea]|uniref:Uncharacterized protein n=1 Tax=Diversispora epigaea TaxID=1348612 RepID=A0A397IVQ8_9GLOM|nr:hypothetical protein Glove_139g40 [Diversispora epigaea]